MEKIYVPAAPDRAAIDALAGATLLEFGANWCGHCMAAQAPLAQAFAGHDAVRHYKIEDGPGRALGRSYRVKLWPTLIFLRDGQEVARLVRPLQAEPISVAFTQIDT
ncbi:thioredoxin [Duganella sp. BJB488]|uniref:thioredoxin family protein n=1 Tax=unclassified Duganella TaxID=2636909 RepID=UPI000E343236|nr:MULTISPECIES: thioredoxin family protein [unclassified Duganella]RFP26267.1 thioredoxin [Duganella sp. BJB489]RFP27992.1 thioredoxin [Duganella sp. BJB488]RFP37199.1 thioredoxin [Duganella sp. BJB480]